MTASLKYPEYASELAQLLEDDQHEWREYSKAEFEAADPALLKTWHDKFRGHVKKRTSRMLEILEAINKPTLTNIGDEGSLAMSVLATHGNVEASKRVLQAFLEVYELDKGAVRFQSIPVMMDWVCLLEKRPQVFGTIWLFDSRKHPFLPTVENFQDVNKRRSEYGIEPLHWPKSLVIPESQQPWLNKPLDALVMREPSESEYKSIASDYV